MIRLGLDDYRPPKAEPATKVEQRSITFDNFPSSLLRGAVAAGVAVDERTAMEYTPFRNGVVLISGDVGKIPRHAYERNADDTRNRLDGSYLERLLRQPNPYINDLDLWATATMHALVWGNGYLEIEWDNALRPIALWPVMPDQMTPYTQGSRVLYSYQGKPIQAEDILHLKGPSYTGVKGDNPVQMARQALGLGLAMERFGGSFFGNGAWPGFMLQHPGTLSDEAEVRLRKTWDDLRRGPDKAFRTAILEEGMTANKLTVEPDKAQLTEGRDFQVVEAARALNLPPHKLKHKMGERPGNNLTESELDYLAGTLDPWLTRIEQECNLKLIPKARRGQWYIEHDRNAYLRMTPEAKATNYKAYVDMKVLSPEQVAKKENLPKPDPPPDPVVPPVRPTPLLPPPSADQGRMAGAQRALVVEVVGRFVRREAEKARRAAKRGPEGFGAWIEDFYAREGEMLRAYLTPGVELELARRGLPGDAAGVARGLAAAYVERSKEELLDLPKTDLEEQVERLMERWEVIRPVEVAEQISAIKGEGNAG